MISIKIDKTVRSGRNPTPHTITHSHPEHTVTHSLTYSTPNITDSDFLIQSLPPLHTQHSTHTLIYYTYQLPHSLRLTHTLKCSILSFPLSLLLTRSITHSQTYILFAPHILIRSLSHYSLTYSHMLTLNHSFNIH